MSDTIDHSDSIHFVRGQLAAAREEVERQIQLRISDAIRLKGLIRQLYEAGVAMSQDESDCDDFNGICLLCRRDTTLGPTHEDNCPAFHPDGTVK